MALRDLQYPRYLHQDGVELRAESVADAERLIAAGATLRPGESMAPSVPPARESVPSLPPAGVPPSGPPLEDGSPGTSPRGRPRKGR